MNAFGGPIGQRVEPLRDRARQLLAERGYGNPGVFGSVARGTDTAGSDLDVVVDLPVEAGMLQLLRTALDLEELLGVRVDLVPRDGLRPRVARDITDEVVPL